MIVVTTPTGQIGGALVPLLLDAGASVRVIARDPARLPGWRDRVDLVEGSHGDAAVLDRALAGAEALFWLVPPAARATDIDAAYSGFTRPAAAAIRRHGVGHVVDITTLGRGTRWQHDAGLVTASLAMDDLLATSGAAQRGLACPGFMDNMLMQLGAIAKQGMFFGVVDPAKRLPQVAVRDIAAVAARLLLNRSWSGTSDVPLLGPEELSFADMAAVMSEVLGRPISYSQVPPDGIAAQLRGQGATEAFATAFLAMMRAKGEGMDNRARREDAAETPTIFSQWCEEVLKPLVQP